MKEKILTIDTEPSDKGLQKGLSKGELTFIAHRYEKKDLDKFRKLFESWLGMVESKAFFNESDTLDTAGRAVNLPEELSEGVVAKDIKGVYRYRKQIKNKFGKSKFDCYNIKTQEFIEVKGCCIKPDLTTWSSLPYFDVLYFVDFSSRDGKYKIFEINITNEELKKVKVNSTETFEEQINSTRRPRFPLYEKFVEPKYKCSGSPCVSGDLYSDD